MHGILLIDKPAGMTSHDVVRQVRRVFKTRKVGHAGTLDPLATGVLAVAVGDGTKILQFLLAEAKSYRATFRLGVTTDTLDATGAILRERPLPAACRAQLDQACDSFRGEIRQVPPMYSALKKNGVPLYKLARKGEQVTREPRPVTIARLEIIEVDLPDVTIEVDCSKGTYIRSLIADIGEVLGCGAHLTALRRLGSGRFRLADCLPWEQLPQATAAALLTLDAALGDFPALQVAASADAGLCHGVPPGRDEVTSEAALSEGQIVRLQAGGQLRAVARFAPGRDKEKRGDFELIRVFLPPEIP
jgi:tRNA pseudouridine55 synthase